MSSYNGGPCGGDETLPYDELWCSQLRHGQSGGGGGSIQLAIVVDSKKCSTVSCGPVLSMWVVHGKKIDKPALREAGTLKVEE